MDWIVCFRSSPNFGLWKLFTIGRQEYGHVFAVRYDPELDLWIRVECASQRFKFDVCCGDDATLLVQEMMECTACVEIKVEDNPIQMPRWLYCVSFVKHVIGVRSPLILTPYQLYCELIKKPHRVIFDQDKGVSHGNV